MVAARAQDRAGRGAARIHDRERWWTGRGSIELTTSASSRSTAIRPCSASVPISQSTMAATLHGSREPLALAHGQLIGEGAEENVGVEIRHSI
jgi:hypothetical protein